MVKSPIPGEYIKNHDDVIEWKHFPRNWPFVPGIHQSPVNSPHKGQWGGTLMFYLICAWMNNWVNNREAGDLRRHRAHYDVIVMICTHHARQCIPSYVVCAIDLSHRSGSGGLIFIHCDPTVIIGSGKIREPTLTYCHSNPSEQT